MLSHYIKGMDPVADGFSGTKYSAVVNLKNYGACEWIIHRGTGGVGTATFSIEACKDLAASEVQPIDSTFVRVSPGDTHSVPASGASITATAGGTDIYILKMKADALARFGWTYVRLKSVEAVAGLVTGAILIRLSEPRYGQVASLTAITLAEEKEQAGQQATPEPPPPPKR